MSDRYASPEERNRAAARDAAAGIQEAIEGLTRANARQTETIRDLKHEVRTAALAQIAALFYLNSPMPRRLNPQEAAKIAGELYRAAIGESGAI